MALARLARQSFGAGRKPPFWADRLQLQCSRVREEDSWRKAPYFQTRIVKGLRVKYQMIPAHNGPLMYRHRSRDPRLPSIGMRLQDQARCQVAGFMGYQHVDVKIMLPVCR